MKIEHFNPVLERALKTRRQLEAQDLARQNPSNIQFSNIFNGARKKDILKIVFNPADMNDSNFNGMRGNPPRSGGGMNSADTVGVHVTRYCNTKTQTSTRPSIF